MEKRKKNGTKLRSLGFPSYEGELRKICLQTTFFMVAMMMY